MNVDDRVGLTCCSQDRCCGRSSRESAARLIGGLPLSEEQRRSGEDQLGQA